MWFFIPIKKNSYRQSSLTVRVLRSLNHHPVTDASILFLRLYHTQRIYIFSIYFKAEIQMIAG